MCRRGTHAVSLKTVYDNWNSCLSAIFTRTAKQLLGSACISKLRNSPQLLPGFSYLPEVRPTVKREKATQLGEHGRIHSFLRVCTGCFTPSWEMQLFYVEASHYHQVSTSQNRKLKRKGSWGWGWGDQALILQDHRTPNTGAPNRSPAVNQQRDETLITQL